MTFHSSMSPKGHRNTQFMQNSTSISKILWIDLSLFNSYSFLIFIVGIEAIRTLQKEYCLCNVTQTQPQLKTQLCPIEVIICKKKTSKIKNFSSINRFKVVFTILMSNQQNCKNKLRRLLNTIIWLQIRYYALCDVVVIFEFILNIIIMGNICPCPKRMKKKESAYDVHEETFQMDQNVQNIGQHSPKHQHQDNENNILTDDLRSSQEGAQPLTHSEEKFIPIYQKEQSIAVQNFQPVSTNNISVDTKNQQQNPPVTLIEHKPQTIVQQKPSFQANILKPKAIKKKYNPDDYRFINENQSFKVKKIDSIKQQQYNIDNCKNSYYFIFDITANLYIDDCENCTIFVAPCESTIFVRNCKRITMIAATKQFRTYQCHDCIFSLYCKSQPVIQSSSNLQFTTFDCPVYPHLPNQFAKTRFQPWNNHWSEIHNFTKKEGQQHFYLHQKIALQVDWNQAFALAQLQIADIKNPIPFIVGDLPYQPKSQVLILANKAISDEILQQKLKDVVILKGFQGVIAGEGKQPKRAILIDARDTIPQSFQQLGKVFTNPSQIEANKAKWFVSFGDQVTK